MSKLSRRTDSRSASPNPCCDPDDATWCLECANSDPASWPPWTDAVRAELPAEEWPHWSDMIVPGPVAGDDDDGPPEGPEDTPEGPGPDEWAGYCRTLRQAHATPDAAGWFRAQKAWYASQSREPKDDAALVVSALNEALVAIESRGLRGPSELEGLVGTRYRRLVLAAVEFPRESRKSRLADSLDEEAQFYLDMGHDLGRLAAFEVLALADAAERMGARSAAEFLDGESDAAWFAACDEVTHDRDYPGPMW